jgi:hypothetical protein
VRLLRGDSIRVVHPLFQTEGGGSTPTSPLQLEIETAPFAYARELNALWHSRLPRMETGFIVNQPFLCFIAKFCGRAYAAAIWSNPVSPNLPQHECLELRRFAIAPDAPKNTASRMLAIMVRFIKKHRPTVGRLVSYQDVEAHQGTIYKASGWMAIAKHKGGSWNRPNSKNLNGTPRTRPDLNGATGPKVRWELEVKPRRAPSAPSEREKEE